MQPMNKTCPLLSHEGMVEACLDRDCQWWVTGTTTVDKDSCQHCSERCARVVVTQNWGWCSQGGDKVLVSEEVKEGSAFCGDFPAKAVDDATD